MTAGADPPVSDEVPASTALAVGLASGRAVPTDATPPWRSALSVTALCCASLGAIFVNKACLTHYDFAYPFFIMLLQSTFTCASISLLGLIDPLLFAPAPVKWRDMHHLATPGALFLLNVSVGLTTLTVLTVPMFSAFRRLTAVFVMVAEYVMLNKTLSLRIVASVLVMSVGAFVSALGDVTFSLLSLVLVFSNNALTAMYLASIKKVMEDLSITPYSLLYHISLLTFTPVLFLSIVSGDLDAALYAYQDRPDLHSSPLFIGALIFASASAMLVNLLTSMSTRTTSPLTTSVAGQLNSMLQTVLGFFSWGYVPTPTNVVGLLVALVGQIAFAVLKCVEAYPGIFPGETEERAGSVDDATGGVESTPLASSPDTLTLPPPNYKWKGGA